jgi:hypothetical protein
MKKLTVEETLNLLFDTIELRKDDKHLRLGQIFMIRLYDEYPEIYDHLLQTEYDPFYSDKKEVLIKCLKYLCDKKVQND